LQNLKFGILGASIIGIIAAFLPFIAFGDESISLFQVMGAPGAAGQVILTMAGFVIGLVLSIIALKNGFSRVFGIVATVGFALSFIKLLDAFGPGAIGAKLLFIGALVGLVLSIVKIVKPDVAQAS